MDILSLELLFCSLILQLQALSSLVSREVKPEKCKTIFEICEGNLTLNVPNALSLPWYHWSVLLIHFTLWIKGLKDCSWNKEKIHMYHFIYKRNGKNAGFFSNLKSLPFLFFNLCFAKQISRAIGLNGAKRGRVRRENLGYCNHTGSNDHMKINMCIASGSLKIALTCMSAFDHNSSMILSWEEARTLPFYVLETMARST